MSQFTVLRFNFANPGGDPVVQRRAITGALELARWGEDRGVQAVSVDEHHASGHGWCANPVLAAGFFLSATRRIVASVDCALGPLWHPVRMAEDIALVDSMSGGRLHVTIGLGYREAEYELLDADFTRRGREMDRLLETLLSAWGAGDDALTPRPFTRPHPYIYVGGGVRASAERAARFGLPLSLPDYLPEIAEHYRQLCRELGHQPIVLMPPEVKRGMVFVHEDPEQAWAELGGHILWEARTYGQWATAGRRSYMHLPGVESIDEVRRSGRYRFLAPQQLVEELRADDTRQPLVLHPLVGGMPVEEAWKSLELLVTQVLPHVNST